MAHGRRVHALWRRSSAYDSVPGLVNYRGLRKQFGDPNNSGHPVVNADSDLACMQRSAATHWFFNDRVGAFVGRAPSSAVMPTPGLCRVSAFPNRPACFLKVAEAA